MNKANFQIRLGAFCLVLAIQVVLGGNSVNDSTLQLPIMTLDSGSTTLKPVIVVPLPHANRLRMNLLQPDSLKSRISQGTLHLKASDLAKEDTLELPPMQAKKKSEFQTFWKQVETANGYDKLQKQMRAAGDLNKTWVPKALFFDSSVVVIPGYLFIRFPAW